jgi:hypothetical protein
MYGVLPQSSPENIVSAPVGAMFMRKGESFYLSSNGTTTELPFTKKAFALQYKSKVWYPTLKEEVISFSTDSETWIKKNGNGKTGWSFLTSKSSIIEELPFVPRESLLINPSFEDGLNGWTVLYETGSDGDVFTYSGSIGAPYSGSFTPPSGDHAVLTDQGGPTTSVLYQDFDVPSVVNNASISFYYAVWNGADNWVIGPNLEYAGPDNQFATIDIMNTVADPLSIASIDGILVNLYTSQVTDPLFSDYKKLTFDITSYLQDCLGQTMRFRVAQVDNLNPLLVGLDDVILRINY